MAGSASSRSIAAISARPVRPSTYPATVPTSVPRAIPITTDARPETSEMGAPLTTRAKMSRPRSSVPNQYVAFGGVRRSGTFCATGSRTRKGPTTAMIASTSRIITPPTAPRLRANRRPKLLLDWVCNEVASPSWDTCALKDAAERYPPLPSSGERGAGGEGPHS